jgi:hypothetical protein
MRRIGLAVVLALNLVAALAAQTQPTGKVVRPRLLLTLDGLPGLGGW